VPQPGLCTTRPAAHLAAHNGGAAPTFKALPFNQHNFDVRYSAKTCASHTQPHPSRLHPGKHRCCERATACSFSRYQDTLPAQYTPRQRPSALLFVCFNNTLALSFIWTTLLLLMRHSGQASGCHITLQCTGRHNTFTCYPVARATAASRSRQPVATNTSGKHPLHVLPSLRCPRLPPLPPAPACHSALCLPKNLQAAYKVQRHFTPALPCKTKPNHNQAVKTATLMTPYADNQHAQTQAPGAADPPRTQPPCASPPPSTAARAAAALPQVN
jgi:hypothetical protein